MTGKIFRGSMGLRTFGLTSTLAAVLLCGAAAISPVRASALSLPAPVRIVADGGCPTAGNNNGNGTKCFVDAYINPLIQAISALVGIMTVISIVIAGIQYSTAGDDPSKIQAAKSRIMNSLFALLAFIFLFALLQWIIPGGIFNG